jgi:two-component system sensor histidine kinase/response regulator
MEQSKRLEGKGLTQEVSQEDGRLKADHVKRLFRTHLQGALVRSGASLFMWVFALIGFKYQTMDGSAFEGVTASVIYLILMNVPTLLVLKFVKQRHLYEYYSLFINALEVIGYTAIIYFLGGFRAAYLTPMYASLITYVGVVAPRRIPLIIATFCALAFALMATLEHLGIIPHQNLVLAQYDFNWVVLTVSVTAMAGLLYVVAFIAGYTGNLLKRARDRLKEKNFQLQESERLKSEFLANMSHEIRTPMNAVIGFTDMLLDTRLDEVQSDYARTAKRSGEALLSLINDILDLSKIEAGEVDFEEIDFDPELLAYDVCELIRPKIESRPIEILCRVGDAIPSHVSGDPLRLRQVLTNLMGNASKFTDSGEIELSIDIEAEKDDRVKFHAMIRDTGIGIQKDKLPTIFTPFRQADGSTTRKYGGTGLGLSICKQISKLMDGDVWAESEVNKGSIFHFTAWLKKAEDKEAKRLPPISLAGKKVLIVDDNQTSLDILGHTLESADIRVVALKKGEAVTGTLKKAQEDGEPFDLCLSDIEMSGTSGYEVAKQIRDSKYHASNIPLIALSSSVKRDAKRCEEAGFDGFLSKPFYKEKLFQMMERIIGERAGGAKKDEAVRPPIMTQYMVRENMKHSVRILLAEDNPVNQKLAKMMLTKAGYQVEVADDGKEVVEKYTRSPEDFDMIFMDVQMPEMDGMEATRAIRSYEKELQDGAASMPNTRPETRHLRPRKPNIPIVAMTAHAMKGDKEICLEAGMDDYIPKPIKRELVFQILEKWVFGKTD